MGRLEKTLDANVEGLFINLMAFDFTLKSGEVDYFWTIAFTLLGPNSRYKPAQQVLFPEDVLKLLMFLRQALALIKKWEEIQVNGTYFDTIGVIGEMTLDLKVEELSNFDKVTVTEDGLYSHRSGLYKYLETIQNNLGTENLLARKSKAYIQILLKSSTGYLFTSDLSQKKVKDLMQVLINGARQGEEMVKSLMSNSD